MNTHEVITLCALASSISYLGGRADERTRPNQEETLGIAFAILLASIVSTAVAITIRVVQ